MLLWAFCTPRPAKITRMQTQMKTETPAEKSKQKLSLLI